MKLQRLAPRVRDIRLSPVREESVSTTLHLRMNGRARLKRNERIMVRDCFTCRICGRVTDRREGNVDHKVPLFKGGSDDDYNLQWLCIDCHARKSAREQQR